MTWKGLIKLNLVLAILSLFAGAARADSILCYGPGFIYTTNAPDGWTLDNESGKSNGLCLVGYPKGGSWKGNDTVIYANATPKGETKGSRNLADMMAYDIEQHKTSSPRLKVKDGPTYNNADRKIPSKFFLNDQKQGNFEVVAYVDEPKAVVFLVMSSRSESSFKKALGSFKQFVERYHLLSSNMEVKK